MPNQVTSMKAIATVLMSGALLAFSAQVTSQPMRAKPEDVCAGLSSIKSIPLNEAWPIDDENYKTLKEKRKQTTPCLIDRITDGTSMKDPRSEPTKVDGFVAGDLAFFLLSDFNVVSFEGVLPQEVRSELPSKGVIAYFDWVHKPGNREKLQAAAKEWVRIHPIK
ncbi:hypothetical protein [Lysobacter firmicutimachus]|uniref:Secreted protein n=1 Tax=Lysobacter firmicutimachus TaxID=1792846 RepID=A0ABU8D0B4_9GAMM